MAVRTRTQKGVYKFIYHYSHHVTTESSRCHMCITSASPELLQLPEVHGSVKFINICVWRNPQTYYRRKFGFGSKFSKPDYFSYFFFQRCQTNDY